MNGDEEFKLGERLGRIESKVDSMSLTVQNLTQGIGATVQSHNREIGELKTQSDDNKGHIAWVSTKADKHLRLVITIVFALTTLLAGIIYKMCG